MRISVVHGPNLNLLGTRQPEVYGSDTLVQLEDRIAIWAQDLKAEATFAQSNDESDLVGMIQDASTTHDAIVLNVGGFTHTSVAIADAVASVKIPTIEVHLSDINRREPWRRKSLIRPAAVRQISGRGAIGYRDAIRHLINRKAWPFETTRYGPCEDNVIDVRHPEGGPGPNVLLVHGGFWLNPWERDTMESLAIALTRDGYTTGNLEYRRSPTWPDSGHDVETAVRLFSNHGEHPALIGHSAGGYLGLWASQRNPLSLYVGLAPMTDLELAEDETESAAQLMESGAPPRPMLPASHLLIHGEDDNLVRPEHSTRFGPESNLALISGGGHFDLLAPSGSHYEMLLNSLSEATF
jgi:3-dehydroquinate dehydratase II